MNPALTTLPAWLDILLALLVIVGAAFALIGSWGLAKLSDFFKRLHGPTKATTLGVGCVLVASALWFSIARGMPSLHELLITLFLFLTAPVSAHLLVKAALRVASPAERPPVPPLPSAPSGRPGSAPAGSSS
jgi:multicomponent K+:H+ antiporter subunit G